MPGFDGGPNGSVVYANNVDFTGTSSTSGTAQVLSDGQLLIGSSVSPNIRVNTLTPGTGVTITNGNGSIIIGLSGGGAAVEHLTGNTGGQLNPDGSNNFNILAASVAAGTTPATVSGSGSTLTINIQKSQAISSTDATKVGLANFNSAQFTVDANGFVSSKSGGFTWNDVTSSTQTLAAQNGYVTDRGGGVTYTLPASGTLGDTIEIVGKAGLATIAQNANQQILLGSTSSTIGVGGSIVSTNAGDCITLICITAGASTVWRANSVIGNWTIN